MSINSVTFRSLEASIVAYTSHPVLQGYRRIADLPERQEYLVDLPRFDQPGTS